MQPPAEATIEILDVNRPGNVFDAPRELDSLSRRDLALRYAANDRSHRRH